MNTKNISEIRRENMEALFVRFKTYVRARFAEEPDRGMMTSFAKASGMSPRYFSHIINGRKEIGHRRARDMETGMCALGPEFDDVVAGWLDNDHDRPKPATYGDESLHTSLEACFRANPIETQRAMNELTSKILSERITKQ